MKIGGVLKIYLVGGAVRDEILNKAINDRDFVVVGSTPSEMEGLGFYEAGKSFPVYIHPDTKEEYALARRENSTGKGYNDYNFSIKDISLKEDLLRRDLTINAIAKDTESGELIDPYGGLRDIKAKLLRPVSFHFSEDPLRVLRAARFLSTLPGFSPTEDLISHSKTIANNGSLKTVSKHRIWREFSKLLLSESPVKGLEFLRTTGVLDVIIPELSRLYGVPQSPIYHPEGCVWTHTMLVLENICKISASIEERFAALVHDLGKGITPKEILPRHIGHEKTGIELVKNLCTRWAVPNEVRSLALITCEHHLRVHRSLELTPKKVLKLFEAVGVFNGQTKLEKLLNICESDSMGKESKSYPQRDYLLKMAEGLKEINYKEEISKYSGKKSNLREFIYKIRILKLKELKNDFFCPPKIKN